MQRSSRDPSVDFYEHSTQRGSTPGVDYFAQASNRRAQRFATGALTPDSSSVSGEGGIPSRSASQFDAFSIDRQNNHANNNNKSQDQDGKKQMQNFYQQQQASEELADEVPARHLSIIEVARQMLLPVFYERLLDRQGLIQCCGTVLDQFLELEKMGLAQMGAPPGHTVDPNQPLTDVDIQQVQKLVQGQLREIQQKRPLAAQHTNQQYNPSSDGLQSEFGAGSSVRGSVVNAQQHQQNNNNTRRGQQQQQQPQYQPNRDDDDYFDHPENYDGLDDRQSSTRRGPNNNNNNNQQQQLARVSGAGGDQTTISGSSAGLINSNPNLPPSIFRSVSYMSKGPLPPAPPPPLPNGKQAASDAFLSLALERPHLTTANSDIVITGIVHTRALVDLRWWIAYGPMKLVIDLEKLRSVGAVGTFQVSHSAFILSIGAGTLIPGAEYTVHISAMAVDFAGIGKDARIEFVVPVAEDETDDILWNRLQRMTSSGYSGDTEKGILSLRPDPQRMKELEAEFAQAKKDAVEQAQAREAAAKAKQAEKDRRAKILLATKSGKIDSATASKLLMSGGQIPPNIQAALDNDEALRKAAGAGGDNDVANVAGTQLPDAAVSLAQQQQQSSSSSGNFSPSGRGLTYHEQLRNFILNEVEPVYTLCASPRFTHEIFLDILRNVTKQFWYVRSGGGSAVLDKDLKKQILGELRKEISDYVQRSSGKVLVNTATSAGGSPKAAEMLQSSLEQVSHTAELGQVSLLSPEQREKLAGIGLQRGGGGGRRGSIVQQGTLMHSTGVGSSPP